jgi:hypothetical protein
MPTMTLRVRPKQYLALCIEAALSRYEGRVMKAGIVECGIPTASLPPFGPFDVIAIFAVGISRFPGCTEDALNGTVWTGDHRPSQRWNCQHRKKNYGNPDQSEFCHAFLP